MSASSIIQPETIARWHRAGFRLYWRWKSGFRGRSPQAPAEYRSLIRRTNLAFRGLVTAELAYEVAEQLAPHLGWETAKARQEAESALSLLTERHGLGTTTTEVLS